MFRFFTHIQFSDVLLSCFGRHLKNGKLRRSRQVTALPIPAKSISGFSLVEIVLALAIITFCLLPIVGLLAIASQQSQSSEETTDLTLILQSQQAILRTESFDALTTQVRTTPAVVYYYATGGQCLNYAGQSATATAPPLAFYKCTVQQTTAQQTAAQQTATQQAAIGQNPSSDDRLCVNLLIQYPAPKYAKQKKFPLSFFRYGPR